MAKTFFTTEEQNQIIAAIKQAEENTSGEIRLHIEAYCNGDAVKRAKEVFEQLGMANTELKNGILFYLAYKDHKYAVVGDSGIHSLVTDAFWMSLQLDLAQYFKNALFAEGICSTIQLCGEKLKQYFPYQSDDVNELSDDISFGEDTND